MPRLRLERVLMNPTSPSAKGTMKPKPTRKPQARQPKTLIYARCVNTRTGIGARIGDIFMTTYSVAQWADKPTCPNCGKGMVKVREGKMPL